MNEMLLALASGLRTSENTVRLCRDTIRHQRFVNTCLIGGLVYLGVRQNKIKRDFVAGKFSDLKREESTLTEE